MAEKPTTAEGYRKCDIGRVRATCLEIASRLGDLTNQTCIIGGLVPLLIINQNTEAAGFEAHVGTLDVDIGLSIAVLDGGLYQEISQRLRNAGFRPDKNKHGNPTFQRWVSDKGDVVDFLIPPTSDTDQGGRPKNLESDFAATITPGLELAFKDQVKLSLEGNTLSGEMICREVTVCGPGAFVVLKALAFRVRGENKDAYDLFYLLQYHEAGLEEIARIVRSFGPDEAVTRAITILREDFASADHVGPRRVAQFIHGRPDDAVQADARGAIADFLDYFDEVPR